MRKYGAKLSAEHLPSTLLLSEADNEWIEENLNIRHTLNTQVKLNIRHTP